MVPTFIVLLIAALSLLVLSYTSDLAAGTRHTIWYLYLRWHKRRRITLTSHDNCEFKTIAETNDFAHVYPTTKIGGVILEQDGKISPSLDHFTL
jgi:hypothetical protein